MPECRVIQIALVMHTNLTNMIAVHPQVLFQLFKQKLLPKLFTCKIVLINLWLLYAVFDELPASCQFKTSTLSNLNHKLRP